MDTAEGYLQAAAAMRARVAELWDALFDGRMTEAEAVAGVLEIRQEAESLCAVAAAEIIVSEAVVHDQSERIAELQQRLDRRPL